MKVERTMTISLSAEEISKIIKQSLEKEGFDFTEKDVNFEIGKESQGYGMGEHDVTVLKGCSIKCSYGKDNE